MQDYKFDAFISYRHLPFDKAVAERLQVLLESYKPPKGINHVPLKGRVFRDQSELPTSGDLGSDIEDALRNSRYLIVICSEETKNSKWCMREIEYFKELHDGKCGNIIAVLISGDPADVFPDSLRHETWNGVEVDLEPLAANITADTQSKSLRLLKVEFLRIMAPILNCGFDDLYRRQHRRRLRRITTISAAAVIAMAAVSVSLGIFANQSRTATAFSLYRQGIESIQYVGIQGMEFHNDYSQGMMFFAEALSLRPNNTAVKAIQALLFQSRTWPFVADTGKGRIIGEALIMHESERVNINETTAVYINNDIPLERIAAYDSKTGMFLLYGFDEYAVADASGNIKDTVERTFFFEEIGYNSFTARGCWLFYKNYSYYIYNIETGTMLILELPSEINPLFNDEYFHFSVVNPHLPIQIAAYGGGSRAAVVFAGYLHFYEEINGRLKSLKTLDLANMFENKFNRDDYLSVFVSIFISSDENILALEHARSVCVVDVNKQMSLFTIEQSTFGVSDVTFSADNTMVAIGYGVSPRLTGATVGQGGSVDVFSLSETGEYPLYSTKEIYSEPVSYVRFNDSGDTLMTFSYNKQLRLWDLTKDIPIERCNGIFVDFPSISYDKPAVFCDNSILATVDYKGTVRTYYAVKPSDSLLESLNDNYTSYYIDSYPAIHQRNLAIDDFSGIHDKWIFDELKKQLENDIFNPYDIYVSPELKVVKVILSGDGKLLYAIGQYDPYFAVYDVDNERKALMKREIILLDKNVMPTNLWQSPDEDYVMFSTEMNELWLFRKNSWSAPFTIIPLRSSGWVDEVTVDSTGTFVAVSIQRHADFGFLDIYGLLEIWDIDTKTNIASITDGNSYINGLLFTDAYLYYCMDGYVHRLWFPQRRVSGNRVDFFKSLSGFDLDRSLAPIMRDAFLPVGYEKINDEWSPLYRIIHNFTEHRGLSSHEQHVGTVVLIVDDIEYKPGINYIHTNQYTDTGELVTGSGIPFEFWLESNIDLLTEIAYSDNMKIMVSGDNGAIITHANHPKDSLTYGEYQLIAVPETDFYDGIAHIHLPEEGAYIVYVEVHWSGEKDDFIRNRYVFKIVT